MSVGIEGRVVDPLKSVKILQNQSSLPEFSHTQVGKRKYEKNW